MAFLSRIGICLRIKIRPKWVWWHKLIPRYDLISKLHLWQLPTQIGESCVIFHAIALQKTRNLALPWLKNPVFGFSIWTVLIEYQHHTIDPDGKLKFWDGQSSFNVFLARKSRGQLEGQDVLWRIKRELCPPLWKTVVAFFRCIIWLKAKVTRVLQVTLTWIMAIPDGFAPELQSLRLEALLGPAGPRWTNPAEEVGVTEGE